MSDIFSLILPLLLVAGGYYIKVNKKREPFAGPNTWKWMVSIGIVGFIIKLIAFILK
jgi:hypothetical protein